MDQPGLLQALICLCLPSLGLISCSVFPLCTLLSVTRLTDDLLTPVWQGFNYQTAFSALRTLAAHEEEQGSSSVSLQHAMSQSLTDNTVRYYIVHPNPNPWSQWGGIDLIQLPSSSRRAWHATCIDYHDDEYGDVRIVCDRAN